MSIEARIRIACWLIVGLTVAVLLMVAQTTRDAERANGVIAVATAAALEQDRSDERLRQVRTAIGDATRAAERGQPPAPATWASLHRQLQAMRPTVHGDEMRLPAAVRAGLRHVDAGTVAFVAVAGRLVRGAEADPADIRGLLPPYLDRLKVLETDQTRVRTMLGLFAVAQSTRTVQLVREWRTGVIAGGGTLLLILLMLAIWIIRDIVGPLKRLSCAIGVEDDVRTDIAPGDEARCDEVGMLARNVAMFGRILVERGDALRRVEHVARHDVLTGLPNRLRFDEALAAAISVATEDGGAVALLCIDVDRFKAVNDRLGHAGGDAVLRMVAGILQAAAGDAALVCRIGGDEFALVMPVATPADIGDVPAMAARLIDAFGMQPVGTSEAVRISVGVALFPDDAGDEAGLRHRADMALYRAKQRGRAQAAFFGDADDRSGDGGLVTVQDRRIADGAVQLLYRPKMDIRTDRIVALEASIRPDRSGDDAMPSDRCGPLIAGMLRQVVRDQAWLATCGRLLPVQVTIPGALAGDAGFADAVLASVADRTGEIGLAIDEATIINDPEAMLAQVQRFVDAGLTIAIAGYGAGWSSLGWLKRMPARELTIDRTLLSGISHGGRDPLLVRSTIDLGHALGMTVTADGVETEAALALLRVMGCDQGTGALIGQTMPLAAVPGCLAGRMPPVLREGRS